jgi:hypothetical protein
MAVYSVSYDLRKPGQNYNNLIQALQQVPSCKPLQSLWFVDTPQDSATLHNALKSHMDANDGLVVTEITHGAGWAVSGIPQACLDWLRARRP